MNNVDMLRAAAAERGEGLKEIGKLASMLTVRGISFIKRPIFDGEQILVPGEWDAVCHRYSYGGPEGLLEVMGDPVTLPGEGAVAGWLTAEDVIRRLEWNAGGASPSPTEPIIPDPEG